MTESMFPDMPPEEPGERPRRSQRREEEQFVDQMLYLITGPYLAYTGFESMLPRRDEITLQRLTHSEEIFEDEMCTEFEAMLYLSTASLSAPMTHDWFAIYMRPFNRWKPEAAEDMDIGVEVLDRNQVEHLDRFRRWMFRTQMNYLKAQDQAANREEVEAEKQQLEVQRPRMFE